MPAPPSPAMPASRRRWMSSAGVERRKISGRARMRQSIRAEPSLSITMQTLRPPSMAASRGSIATTRARERRVQCAANGWLARATSVPDGDACRPPRRPGSASWPEPWSSASDHAARARQFDDRRAAAPLLVRVEDEARRETWIARPSRGARLAVRGGVARSAGRSSMQSTGHGGKQSSQPVHCAAITVCICRGAPTMASTGQAGRQRAQPMQRSSSIHATCARLRCAVTRGRADAARDRAARRVRAPSPRRRAGSDRCPPRHARWRPRTVGSRDTGTGRTAFAAAVHRSARRAGRRRARCARRPSRVRRRSRRRARPRPAQASTMASGLNARPARRNP